MMRKETWGTTIILVCGLFATDAKTLLGQCEMAELVPVGPSAFATFYQAGAIDGDYIVAADFNQGGFYVFHRTGTTWFETSHSATPPIGGLPLAISGDYIVAGVPTDGTGGSMAGVPALVILTQ